MGISFYRLSNFDALKNKWGWDFPGGPLVKKPLSNAGDYGCIPGWGTKIPHPARRDKKKKTRVSGVSGFCLGTSLVAQMVKRLPTMWETQVQSLSWEDLLEKEMATHFSILAWKIPWKEEPGML